jgi:hypothetical protein
MTEDVVSRVRAICAAFPEVTERPSHGAPTWFIRDKKTFVMLWPDGHHDDDFVHLWCAAPPGAQQELIAAQPETYFYPAYVGYRGWVGVRLGDAAGRATSGQSGTDPSARGRGGNDRRGVDWGEVAEVLEDAYRTIAPKTLIAMLDANSRSG